MPGSPAFPAGVVATPHYLASSAGLAVLADGGNAVDAIVAANLVLGVVTPYYCGFGGDLLALVHDGGFHAYRGVGRAPHAATVDVVRDRSGSDQMPVLGAHSVTVPGAIDGWFTLLERWGTRSFGDLARTARRHAADGFTITEAAAHRWLGCRRLYRSFPDWLAAYADVAAGAHLRQPALAELLDRLAADGPDGYYRGPVADAIVDAIAAGGGVMTADDLALHRGEWVDPLRAEFRGHEILELPPPTQGVTALEALRIVDALDLERDDVDRHHLMIEAMKLALVDRDDHVGDPDTMRIDPEVLCSDEWVAARRADIDPTRARRPTPRPSPDGGTAYLCAADADGLLVSLIQSNFTAAGSGVHVPRWGINLHNRGSSFRLDPQHVNAIGPAKLPMHTLIPAMATRGGAPWLVFGAMGGHGQAQTHLQLLVRMLVDGDDPQRAIDAPRWAVDPGTWWITAESRFDQEMLRRLVDRGHVLRTGWAYDDAMGHAHAIERLAAGYRAGTDPRAEGAALGH
ncbi:MAG TPA: gamma-glutamyltransferase family protein [Acidimicrobiia bacterium]|nr:gamma-glutamyltransferase family protein [Acidimicrobiia bacterium]